MTYREFQRESLKQYLTLLLKDRSISEAAKEAGVNRTYLYRLMDRVGMPRRHNRASWKLQGLRATRQGPLWAIQPPNNFNVPPGKGALRRRTRNAEVVQ